MSEWGPPPVPGGRSEEERERARQEREARRSGGRTPAVGEPRRQRAPRVPRAPRAPRAPGSRRRAGIPVLVVLVLIVVAVGWFLMSLFQPLKGDGDGEMRVVIPTGASLGEIGEVLEREGVIDSSFFFELRARLGGKGGDLRSGTYRLPQDAAYSDLLDELSAGPPVDVLNVTVPEGRSREEVAPIVRKAGLEGNYLKATARSRELDPSDYGAKRARSLEGFLFPSTYELKRNATARTLAREQLRTFESEFGKVNLAAAKRKNLTEYDVLIIASMVEREAQIDKERPVIASVIYNRLSEGIPLGIDATTRYYTGNWERPLRMSELQDNNPYNTRLNQGLPPTPIGNPGLASIKAAARPANTDYLFYVVKPGTCGEHDFSETNAEFERDVARYNAEREKRGGKSPTDC